MCSAKPHNPNGPTVLLNKRVSADLVENMFSTENGLQLTACLNNTLSYRRSRRKALL